MVLCMTHYYFLKKLIDKLPATIHNNMEYDNKERNILKENLISLFKTIEI